MNVEHIDQSVDLIFFCWAIGRSCVGDIVSERESNPELFGGVVGSGDWFRFPVKGGEIECVGED